MHTLAGLAARFERLDRTALLACAAPAAGAWALLFAREIFDLRLPVCYAPRTLTTQDLGTLAVAAIQQISVPALALESFIMAVAMALPMAFYGSAYVAFCSYRSTRKPRVLVFLSAYLTLWTIGLFMIGFLALVLRNIAAPFAWQPALVCAAACTAALYRMAAFYDRSLTRAHARPALRPSGASGMYDILSFAGRSTSGCVTACGPMMSICWLAAFPVSTMIMLSAIGAIDHVAFRPSARTAALALCTIGGLQLLPQA